MQLFFDGDIVPYEDAKVHILSTAFKYAASVFEGIRAYWSETEHELYVFRLDEHLERLHDSATMSRMPLPYGLAEMREHIMEVIRRNAFREDLHVRVLAFVEADNGLLDATGPVGVAIAPMPMGRYPEKTAKPGLDVGVSSWGRIADTAMPPRIKAVGNYHNSRLALLQARADGYDDAILLNERGKVSEGPGYNLFLARHGRVVTPSVTSGILEGVTRDTLIHLLADVHNVAVEEREIDRTELYVADEAFFCGSGKEVSPIRSVDRHPLAGGPWAERIKQTYFEVVRGQRPLYRDWLVPVYA